MEQKEYPCVVFSDDGVLACVQVSPGFETAEHDTLEKLMNQIADLVHKKLVNEIGFSQLMFDLQDPPQPFYEPNDAFLILIQQFMLRKLGFRVVPAPLVSLSYKSNPGENGEPVFRMCDCGTLPPHGGFQLSGCRTSRGFTNKASGYDLLNHLVAAQVISSEEALVLKEQIRKSPLPDTPYGYGGMSFEKPFAQA